VSPRSHIILSVGALALILGIAVQTMEQSPFVRATLLQGTVDIGIEHTNPLSLRFEYTTRNGEALLRIVHSSDETIFVSIPAEWERGEVSGTSLSAVHKDKPTFGFVRWHFPPHSGITFSIEHAPENIVIHNSSEFPLKLRTANADLLAETVQRDVFLIQDAAVEIW